MATNKTELPDTLTVQPSVLDGGVRIEADVPFGTLNLQLDPDEADLLVTHIEGCLTHLEEVVQEADEIEETTE